MTIATFRDLPMALIADAVLCRGRCPPPRIAVADC